MAENITVKEQNLELCSPFKKEQNGVYNFILDSKLEIEQHESKLENIAKNSLKRIPWLYYLLRHIFCAGFLFTRSPRRMLSRYLDKTPGTKMILNIGSASDIVRNDVINLDIIYTPNVDIVADATALPFTGEQFDAVICDMTLEHVRNHQGIVKEIKRVLKPGGYLYVSVPFMTPYHSAPGDYYRWTKDGLGYVFEEYDIKELDSRDGPASGLAYVLVDFFSILLSFNIEILRKINIILFLIIFSPVKLLDLILVHYRSSHVVAGMVYIIAKKK